MSAKPPRLAIWILKHFGCSPDTEVLIGDLLERYSQEQSQFWLWRQILTSIAGGFLEGALAHKKLMLEAVVMGWAGVLVFRGGILELVSNVVYIRYVNPLDPSAFKHLTRQSKGLWEPVIENGKVAAAFLPAPWAFTHSGTFLICTLIWMGITGLVVARVGGEHRKAAVFSYAGSLLIVMLIGSGPVLVLDFLGQTGQLSWRGLGIMFLNIAAVLVAGLWPRSSRVNPPRREPAS